MTLNSFKANRQNFLAKLDANFDIFDRETSRTSLLLTPLVSKLWSFKLAGGEQIFSSPVGPLTLQRSDNALFNCVLFQTMDWYVYALKISDGTQLWRTATG